MGTSKNSARVTHELVDTVYTLVTECGVLGIHSCRGFTHSQAPPRGPHETLPEEIGEGPKKVSLMEQTWESETATTVGAA